MNKPIQLFSNNLGQNELQAISKIFKSKWLGYGTESKKFEKEFATSIGSKYALGLNCATAGLFLSMDILGMKKGDEVIIPSITFIGCANAIFKSGAKPIFADVDPQTLNILPEEVSRLKTKRTRAILLLHYGGHPCDMDSINKALGRDKSKIDIIEDSANSIQSTYKGKYTGTLGTLGVFSFDAMKTLVTADGGMITLQNKQLYKKALAWRYLGMKPEQSSGYDIAKKGVSSWWDITASAPGNRYIINDVTSAIGREQLKKVNSIVTKRKRIWKTYKKYLKNIAQLTIPPEPLPDSTSSYYMFWLQTDSEKRRNQLAKKLQESSIYATFRYFPLHLVPFYKHKGKLTNAEKVYETTLNIPIHQNLSQSDVNRVIKTILKWAKNA